MNQYKLTLPGLILLIVTAFALNVNGQTSLEEIISDMTLPHEGRPHGVLPSVDWSQAPRYGAEAPPDTWDAAITWGQLYEWIEGNPATNTRVQIRDLEMFYLSKADLEWHQLQSALVVEGAAYVEDFAGDVNKPADIRKEEDGSVSVTAGDGYNFHYWPKDGRINFPKGDVKGVYTTVRARLIMDDPEGVDDLDTARYVMGVGGDWWESLTAVWDNWTTNWDMGIGRFRFVTREWKSFNMISLPSDSVYKYPPPFHVQGPGVFTDQNETGIDIEAWPNPVGETLHLRTAHKQPVYYHIFNASGNSFEAGTFSESIAINASGFAPGLYLVRLESDHRLVHRKFIVE